MSANFDMSHRRGFCSRLAALSLSLLLAVLVCAPAAAQSSGFQWDWSGFGSPEPATNPPTSPPQSSPALQLFAVNPPQEDPGSLVAKVYGGTATDPERYPYLVSLRKTVFTGAKVHFCGGSLIASDKVLTAAHCLDDPAHVFPEVHVGRYCQNACEAELEPYNTFLVAQAVDMDVFPGWDKNKFYAGNDMAILTLDRKLDSPTVGVSGPGVINLWAWRALTVVGLGLDQSGALAGVQQEGGLPYRTNQECADLYADAASSGKVNLPNDFEVRDDMLCAGGFDATACRGDSGGPLLITGDTPETDILVGVVSFGVICSGTVTTPAIFSRATAFADFIDSHLESSFFPNSSPPPPPPPPRASPPPPKASPPPPKSSPLPPPKSSPPPPPKSSPPPPPKASPPPPPPPLVNQISDSLYTFTANLVCSGSGSLQTSFGMQEAQCRAKCTANSSCKMYSFAVLSSSAGDTKCELRSSCAQSQFQANSFIGFKKLSPSPPPPSSVSYSLMDEIACKDETIKKIVDVWGAAACQAECTAVGECNFWTYNKDIDRCYLKDTCTEQEVSSKEVSGYKQPAGAPPFMVPSSPPSTWTWPPSVVSAPSAGGYIVTPNVLCQDVAIEVKTLDSETKCQDACDSIALCNFYTFNGLFDFCTLTSTCSQQTSGVYVSTGKKTGSSGSVGGSKSSPPAPWWQSLSPSPSPSPSSGSGLLPLYDVLYETACLGVSVKSHEDVSSLEACAAKCTAVSNCVAGTYDKDKQSCFLKAACPTVGTSDDNISFVRKTGYTLPIILEEVGCKDETIERYEEVTVGQCSSLCESYTGCVAFTFNSKTDRCFLKASCEDQEEHENDTTGFFEVVM